MQFYVVHTHDTTYRRPLPWVTCLALQLHLHQPSFFFLDHKVAYRCLRTFQRLQNLCIIVNHTMYIHDWDYGDHTPTITLHVWHVLIFVLLLVANPRRYRLFEGRRAYVVPYLMLLIARVQPEHASKCCESFRYGSFSSFSYAYIGYQSQIQEGIMRLIMGRLLASSRAIEYTLELPCICGHPVSNVTR